MSETDDTDELLIVPPDYYSLNPDLLETVDYIPCFGIVENLITQVNKLEDKVNSMQTLSDGSFLSVTSDDMRRFRKFSSSEELPTTNSTQSTPQRPRQKFTLNSLPASPNMASKKPKSQVPKDRDSMFGEIDHFISHVKTMKRLSAMRSLENELKNPNKLDINQVDAILKDMELEQRELDERIQEAEKQVYGNQEKPFVKEKTWREGDNVESVPDLGLGMRANMYPEVRETFVKKNVKNLGNERVESESSSDSTQMTAFNRFNEDSREDCKVDDGIGLRRKLFESSSDCNLELVSLSNLWKPGFESQAKMQQKLQEERLRREHCEETIKDLQNRCLELQERIAVAIQVDEAKDKAIMRFHDCWVKVNNQLKEVDKQKQELEDALEKQKKKSFAEAQEAAQKISRFEVEASKALDVAHISQDKLSLIEKDNFTLKTELATLQTKYQELEKKCNTELDKNRKFPEILAQKELELNESKTVLSEARKEVNQSRKAVEACQTELSTLKNEYNELKAVLSEERQSNAKLNEQKTKLLDEISSYKNVERDLQEQIKKARDQTDSNQKELKHFYQGQVELVVQNKVKEFQTQLDAAERAFKEEMTKKELTIAKNAASHIQQISDKYSLEIRLLEEKHHEENRLHQFKISQLHEEADDSATRLKKQQDRYMLIERQLHTFMESLKEENVTNLDDVNTIRSKPYTNLEEILLWKASEDDKGKKDETDKNSQLTYRVAASAPVTSRSERDRGAKKRENLLQETIQMLLSRKAGSEVRNPEEAQQVTKENLLAFSQKGHKDHKSKPPWK